MDTDKVCMDGASIVADDHRFFGCVVQHLDQILQFLIKLCAHSSDARNADEVHKSLSALGDLSHAFFGSGWRYEQRQFDAFFPTGLSDVMRQLQRQIRNEQTLS